jgi:large subunit ribosomal protein L1
MAKISKRTNLARNLIIKSSYSFEESLKILKQTATAKFTESAEAHFCLNIDTKYSDQQLRTTIKLPQGTGKEIKIAVLSTDLVNPNEIYDAGATFVGSNELIEEISTGRINFDLLLTTPEMMPRLTKLGKISGPRGLMPSTKAGTVTTNIKKTLEEFKSGKIECRADKTGVVHLLFGKMTFTEEALSENLRTVYDSIQLNKPTGVKGKYLKTFKICTTMGPSINIDLNTLV